MNEDLSSNVCQLPCELTVELPAVSVVGSSDSPLFIITSLCDTLDLKGSCFLSELL